MLIIAYDISDNKLRTKFSKYLKKFGYRLQYSVFKIKNSERVLKTIKSDIEANFLKRFSQEDSVLIFDLSEQCKIKKYGFAKNEDDTIMFL